MADAENRCSRVMTDELTPDSLYERQWAVTVLENALRKLRAESLEKGGAERFDSLKKFIVGDNGKTTYAEVGETLGLSEGAAKMMVHRLRQRFRRLLRDEVGTTVSDEVDIDDEIRD